MEEPGEGRRSEVLNKSFCLQTSSFEVYSCAVGWRPQDELYQFSAGWRKGGVGRKWKFCQIINLVGCLLGLIRPWGRKYSLNKQLLRFPAFYCSWRQLKNITSKKSYLNPFELPLGNFTVANLNLITPSQNNFRKEKGAPVWKYYSFIHTSAKTFISLSPRSKFRLDIVLLKIWNSCDLIFFSSWIFIK